MTGCTHALILCMRLLFSVILALLLSVAALAQDAPSQPTGGASREKILQFIEAMRLRQQMDAMMAGMKEHVRNQTYATLQERTPELTEEDLQFFAGIFDDVMAKAISVDEIVDDIIPVYQKYMTDAELDAIIAFYSSPIGQALLDKMPAMTQEGMQVTMAKSQTRMREVLDTIERRTREYFEQKEKKAKQAPAPKS